MTIVVHANFELGYAYTAPENLQPTTATIRPSEALWRRKSHMIDKKQTGSDSTTSPY
jgi:hypothetical protein